MCKYLPVYIESHATPLLVPDPNVLRLHIYLTQFSVQVYKVLIQPMIEKVLNAVTEYTYPTQSLVHGQGKYAYMRNTLSE